MVNRRSRRKTPSRITRGGITAVRVGKDDVFLFSGRKLKSGTVGIFGSKGQLRVGVFTRNGKKTPARRKLRKGRRSTKSRKLTKTRSRGRSVRRSLK